MNRTRLLITGITFFILTIAPNWIFSSEPKPYDDAAVQADIGKLITDSTSLADPKVYAAQLTALSTIMTKAQNYVRSNQGFTYDPDATQTLFGLNKLAVIFSYYPGQKIDILNSLLNVLKQAQTTPLLSGPQQVEDTQQYYVTNTMIPQLKGDIKKMQKSTPTPQKHRPAPKPVTFPRAPATSVIHRTGDVITQKAYIKQKQQ